MIKFFLKSLLRGLLLILLLLLLVLALLASQSVNRWLFEQVQRVQPQLNLDFVDGHLWRGWHFNTVRWEDGETRVLLQDLHLQWAPECLWGATLCIDRLALGQLQLWLPAAEQQNSSPVLQLPEIRLPVAIRVESFTLGALQLDEQPPLLQALQLKAHASADQLVIEHFSGEAAELSWQLDADLRFKGDWPLRLDAHLQLPELDQRPQQARMRLSGSLANLEVDLLAEGYLNARLQGGLQPLNEHLPMQLALRSDTFHALQQLPNSLTLEALQVQAAGDLQQGIRLQADARLPGSGGPVGMQLSALTTLHGVPELDLKLQVVDQPEQQLQLNGQLDWRDGLQARARLQLQQAFPWYWLYPLETGDITLRQSDLQIQLQGADYQGILNAELTGVAEQALAVDLQFAGDAAAVELSSIQVVTAAGRLQGRAGLQFAEGLVWNAALQLLGLDPGVFIAQLPGQLDGQLHTQGRLQQQQLELDADWQIEGRLRHQPLQLNGRLAGHNSQWTLTDLLLQQGDNRISGQGFWSAEGRHAVQGQLQVQLPQLDTVWPGLAGALSGQVDLDGTAAAPRLRLDLDGRRLAHAESRLARLQLTADALLTERLPGQLSLDLLRMDQGDTRIGNLSLQLRGELAEHRLDLELDRGLLDMHMALFGNWRSEGWRGELREAMLASGEMEWQLAQSAVIDYRAASSRVQLAAHCWRQQDARLCFEGDQQLAPEPALQLSLRNFQTEVLAPLLPEDFSWEALLEADLSFSQRRGTLPTAHLHIRSEEGAFELVNQDRTLRMPYQRIELESRLLRDLVRTRLQLISDSLGQVEVNADLTDPDGARRLAGDYRLQGVRLDILQPFLGPVDNLRGELSGSGRLLGSLQQPAAEGELLVSDANVSGATLPVSLEQLQLRVQFNQQSAELNSRWQSGEHGQAQLTGRFDWEQSPSMQLALSASQLPVRVDPWADVLASLDLQLALNQGQLSVSGQVAIPEGDIAVRDLPEGAVRLSPDVVILGEEQPLAEPPLDIRARVRVLVGDQLRLSAFGLRGRLSGQLEVEETLNASGDLNILDGQYRGYGQRLSLRRAQLLFAGPISQPFLNIEAIRTSGEVVAGLRLTGRADSPQSEVFSEPAMAQEQALSWLILGRPLGAGGGDQNMLGQAALALGMAGSAPLAQSIASTLGIENFQLETEGSGLMTQVVAAGYLTDKLSLRYGVGVFEPANQLALRYELTRRLYLEAVSGFASSLDFFYRIDFGSTQVQP